jgi:hypothetical protein
MTMPILKYFAVVGAALMALLFVADATLVKGPPAVTTSSLYGLPKPWKPDPTQTLAVTPAPEPDMSSAAVAAAAPKPEPQQTAKVEVPKKKRHVAARRPIPDEARQSFAWSRDGRQNFAWRSGGNPFGGSGFFGRF